MHYQIRKYRRSNVITSSGGVVFLAIDIRTNEKVAIKKVNLKNQKLDELAAEIYIMKTSRHVNIVKYIDSYLKGDYLWVVMEYMSAGMFSAPHFPYKAIDEPKLCEYLSYPSVTLTSYFLFRISCGDFRTAFTEPYDRSANEVGDTQRIARTLSHS